MTGPSLWLVAGADGVGKTTYARAHLKAVTGSVRFVNVDELARGLSPLEPDAGRIDAGRLALARARAHIAAGESFAVETTLAGTSRLRLATQARAAGFRVKLLFFAVPSVDICLDRVARRVAMGGHDVPEADVRRRFARGIAGFQAAARTADLWRLFDASSAVRVIAEGSGPSVRWAEEPMPELGGQLIAGLAAA